MGYNVGIYDEKGDIKWNLLSLITSKKSSNKIIFEAPLDIQQAVLIAEFGQRVDIGEVKLENVVSIESQRRGFLSKASFSISPMKKGPEGSPATKFIYHIIRNKHPVEQSELIYITNLPRRTVQASIEELRNQGLIIEKNSLDYTRKKIHNLMKEEWIYMLNLILILNFIIRIESSNQQSILIYFTISLYNITIKAIITTNISNT